MHNEKTIPNREMRICLHDMRIIIIRKIIHNICIPFKNVQFAKILILVL